MSSSETTTTTRKRKSRAVETLAQWKECNVDTKRSGKIQAIGSKKGCMKGKGGPQNAQCTYRGVRQRTLGKWVVEIRKPNRGKRLWVGTFSNSVEAACAYDEAARILYGSFARLNFPAGLDSATTSNYSEIPLRNEDGESIATSSAVEEDLPELFNDDFFKDIEDIGQLGCLDVNDDFFENMGSFFDDGKLGCLEVDQCGAPSGVS